jgi:hypothetical protein
MMTQTTSLSKTFCATVAIRFMRWRINQLFAEKPYEQQQTVLPCAIENRLASAMTLQAPIPRKTF